MRDFVDLLREAMQSTSKTLRLCLLLLMCSAAAFGLMQLVQLVPFVRLT
jgi:hypothetical protein